MENNPQSCCSDYQKVALKTEKKDRNVRNDFIETGVRANVKSSHPIDIWLTQDAWLGSPYNEYDYQINLVTVS